MECLSKAHLNWRENHNDFYEFTQENFLDWPISSVQWGPVLQSNAESMIQRVYFSCKTDGIFNSADENWQNVPNYILIASTELPTEDHYFIPQLRTLFNYDAPKKHPYLRIKQTIVHPGQVTVIRAFPNNRKILASKNDKNSVFLWSSDKYKIPGNQSCSIPDISLIGTTSDRANYALRFTPSLPRILSASGDRLQLFDTEAPATKRQLGSMVSSQSVRPVVSMSGQRDIQQIAFKSNEICVTGGLQKQIVIWDIRMGQLCNKLGATQSEINTVAYQDHWVLSGCEDGRLSLFDDRNNSRPFKDLVGIGCQNLQIVRLRDLSIGDFNPLFIHQGLKQQKCTINEFDWSAQCDNAIVCTAHEDEGQTALIQGGIMHIFKPNSIFFDSQDYAIERIKKAYNRLSSAAQKELLKSIK